MSLAHVQGRLHGQARTLVVLMTIDTWQLQGCFVVPDQVQAWLQRLQFDTCSDIDTGAKAARAVGRPVDCMYIDPEHSPCIRGRSGIPGMQQTVISATKMARVTPMVNSWSSQGLKAGVYMFRTRCRFGCQVLAGLSTSNIHCLQQTAPQFEQRCHIAHTLLLRVQVPAVFGTPVVGMCCCVRNIVHHSTGRLLPLHSIHSDGAYLLPR